MNEPDNSEKTIPSDLEPYRYPWARSLMLLVVYGALMVFLWHFPTAGGRAFFRDLFRGLLTVAAGVAVVGVTALVFLFILPAPAIPPDDDTFYDDEESLDYDSQDFGHILTARAIMVSALKKRETEPLVWEVLSEMEEVLDCVILGDAYTGIVAVSEDRAETDTYNVQQIIARLKAAGIAVRRPR